MKTQLGTLEMSELGYGTMSFDSSYGPLPDRPEAIQRHPRRPRTRGYLVPYRKCVAALRRLDSRGAITLRPRSKRHPVERRCRGRERFAVCGGPRQNQVA